jgi:hypothetical protein
MKDELQITQKVHCVLMEAHHSIPTERVEIYETKLLILLLKLQAGTSQI